MKTSCSFFTTLSMVLFCASFGNAQILDQAFPTVNGEVKTICIHGNTLYIGGNFTAVGGQYRRNLAAIDIPTKSVKAWAPNPDNEVADIEAYDGKVYFCGLFTMVHSSMRNAFAIADSITGAVDPYNPTILFPGVTGLQTGTISKLEIIDNTLYLAGYFISINGNTRRNIAAIDLPSGNLTPFEVEVTTPVSAIKAVDNVLYFGGQFFEVNGVSRSGFAAVDRFNGDLLPWSPSAGGTGIGNTVYEIEPDGENMILSGFRMNLNNSGHCSLVKIDAAENPFDWAPFSCNNNNPSSIAQAVLVSENYLIIGGEFDQFNGELRNHLVLMNKATGALNNWIPNPDNRVMDIQENDSLIVVGGRFETISGVSWPHLAVYSKDDLLLNVSQPGESLIQEVSGYPNPTRSTFSIKLPRQDVKNIFIYSKDGKIVNLPYQVNGTELFIHAESLQTGEYFVRFETKAGKRFVAAFIRS